MPKKTLSVDFFPIDLEYGVFIANLNIYSFTLNLPTPTVLLSLQPFFERQIEEKNSFPEMIYLPNGRAIFAEGSVFSFPGGGGPAGAGGPGGPGPRHEAPDDGQVPPGARCQRRPERRAEHRIPWMSIDFLASFR